MLQIKIDSDSKVIAIYYLDDEKEGWIQVDSIPEPEQIEGKVPVMYYRNGAIEYEYEDVPEVPAEEIIKEPQIPYKDQVIELIRQKYTIDDEIAILRQQNTKPDEYQAWNDYCESCKAIVKEKLGMI